ncbi:amidase [Microbacterium sp. KUDC0406]|uniref:amidase n=1 Tax=Microbacterium sp. KUDC0406 TaxID=2909588 RepID=UPI001F373D95|nr:amidase [Microbacterium sp. KUDC0406]UJP10853.1 amidase [Microbacterium sp. KUDC0406]
MSALHDLTAAAQLRALRDREVSSRELTEHYLDRIDRLAGPLGAFVTVVPESALAEADRADEQLAAGEGGTLTGIPLGIKDLHATAGIRTTAGSAALADLVPPRDAWTVGLLRGAGAVVVGKTSTAELGSTCYTENYVTDHAAVTPFDTTRYSSGSSGGAATAVAAGLLPFAHGSDSAGSIRTPAATCNLVGVKPSRGLVSIAPASTFLAMGTEGPLARTVEDAAVLLDAMAQSWPGDIYGWRAEAGFAAGLEHPLGHPLTIGVWTETGLDGVDEDAEVSAAVRTTAELLRGAGHDVRELPIPARLDADVVEALRVWLTYAVAMSATTMTPPERYGLFSPLTQHLIREGQGMAAAEVLLAQARLAAYASAFLAAFDGIDVALTPTTARPPVPIGHFLKGGLEQVLTSMLDWSCPTPWVNFTGQPALALPAGFADGGLPLSVQLVGRPRADADLLRLAAQVESAQEWSLVRPDVWNA